MTMFTEEFQRMKEELRVITEDRDLWKAKAEAFEAEVHVWTRRAIDAMARFKCIEDLRGSITGIVTSHGAARAQAIEDVIAWMKEHLSGLSAPNGADYDDLRVWLADRDGDRRRAAAAPRAPT